MGLKLHNDGRVEFDDSHQFRVNTSLEKNMTRKIVGDVRHYSVFRRNKGRAGDEGDGNPLIYALKGMNGHWIDPRCRAKLMERAHAIVHQDSQKLTADLILPVPSSYDFCREFSRLLSQWLDKPLLDSSFINKTTLGETLAAAKTAKVKIRSRSVLRDYKHQLNVWSQLDPSRQVSMKEVKPKIRQYFNIFSFNDEVPDLKGKHVLIVDDLMSSGTSMRCIIGLLRNRGATVDTGLCFLSAL